MAKIVALLDSMWGWGGHHDAGEEAPRYFRISPDNHSGKRLARLVGNHTLLVTNSCKIVQPHANAHGIPDADWVRENLIYLDSQGTDLFLICGRVAQCTFKQSMTTVTDLTLGPERGKFFISDKKWASYFFIDHPAARRWSADKLHNTTIEIEWILKRGRNG